MPALPAFGLNRFDYTSPQAFAADARRAEALGWDYAFIPLSPLLWQDPYVYLAFAACGTPERIAGQLREVLQLGFPIEMIVPHPVPTPPPRGPRPDYVERFGTEVIPLLKAEMGVSSA
jgi:alkanesulfonate monooxygenase SsuD/methylene tetrahydromethanopterin reductase-like flavin-dependent oxidoreductase (luciferase family)